MRATRRVISGVPVALLIGAMLSGCGNGTSSSQSVSEKDDYCVDTTGPITVYSGRSEELVSDLFVDFTVHTGIEVKARFGDSGELAGQLLTEASASPADVFFSQDAGALGAVSKMAVKLPDNLIDRVPAAYRSSSRRWVGTSGRVRVLIYNPDLVPAPPASIDELANDQWRGRIGFAPTNASWQSFVTALRVVRGDGPARAWLEAFAENEPVPYEKNAAVRDAVERGEVALGLVNHYYLYELIEAEGAESVRSRNQFFVSGDVGGLVNVAGVAVGASGPNRDGALCFVQFLLGAKGQKYFVERTYEYPLVEGVDQPAGLPALAQLEPPEIDLSDLADIAATQDMLDEVGLLTR